MEKSKSNIRCVLVLAPHLRFPLRNGSDLLIDRRWAAFSRLIDRVDILGESTFTQYVAGERVFQDVYSNEWRNEQWSAIRTIVKRGNYLQEKFITSSFLNEVYRRGGATEYELVVFSYLATYDACERELRTIPLRVIETHNDDLAWFANLKRKQRNPLARLVSDLSRRWTEKFLVERGTDRLTLLTVTHADSETYARYVHRDRIIVAPVGVTLPDMVVASPPDSIGTRLVFIGSLSSQMNVDALRHFRERFWQSLRTGEESVEVDIIGSNPGSEVRELVAAAGWNLHPNVPDAEVGPLFSAATASILPFPYSTGAKLKLLTSLAQGIPFLGTSAIAESTESVPDSCLISDDPSEWAAHLKKLKKTSRLKTARSLRSIAAEYSWDAIADRLARDLDIRSISCRD